MTAVLAALGVFLLGFLVFGACVFLERRYVPLQVLQRNNEMITHYLAIVMGLYGVLSGFIIVSLWEQQRMAEDNIVLEASELRTVFRLSQGLGEPVQSELRQASIGYARAVIEREWQRLVRGDPTLNFDHPEKDRMWRAIVAYEPRGPREEALYEELLSHFEDLSDARRKRCYDAQRGLPAYLWLVFLVGSFLCLACILFIGTESLRTEAFLTGICGGLVCLLIFVVYDLQSPFRGRWIATPRAFESALERMQNSPPQGSVADQGVP